MEPRTNDKAREECIDPAHDESLGDHHSDIAFHRAHHTLHHSRIRHWIWPWLSSALRVGKKRSIFVGLDEVGFAVLEGGWGDDISVCAEVDAAEKTSLLANFA